MRPENFLEGLNDCINRFHKRKAKGGLRYFEKQHIRTDYPLEDRRFTQDLHKLIREYLAGDYYQAILKAKEVHAGVYKRKLEKKNG